MLGCATQMCFFLMLAATESFLLAVMAYACYMAMCNPLHYPLVVNHRMCIWQAMGSWICGIPVQIGQTCQIFSPHFCYSNQINHFFCDMPPILNLACGDASLHELSVYAAVLLIGVISFMLILAYFSKIISTILRLRTSRGRAKAYSTCSSHLLVVLLFFGSAIITYLRPQSSHSPGIDKLLCFIPLWILCLIPWYTVLGTRIWLQHSENYYFKNNSMSLFTDILTVCHTVSEKHVIFYTLFLRRSSL